MFFPKTFWSLALLITILAESIIILAFQCTIFAIFQTQIEDYGITTSAQRTVPTYLALYIFAFIYVLYLTFDALRLRHMFQVLGLFFFHIPLLVSAILQINQIYKVIFSKSTLYPLDKSTAHLRSVWYILKPFVITIPAVITFAMVCLLFTTFKLYQEFGWSLYKHIGADIKMRRRYYFYQTLLALLKFDFFFFLGFTIQFLVIVLDTRDMEFILTIVVIPVTIFVLLFAAWSLKNENKLGICTCQLFYLGGLAYFLFKLIRMYQKSQEIKYIDSRKMLTAFAIVTVLFLVLTIFTSTICFFNFDKGLMQYVSRSTDDDASDSETRFPLKIKNERYALDRFSYGEDNVKQHSQAQPLRRMLID